MKASKQVRHETILRLIEETLTGSQADLGRQLAKLDIKVTQATLSRDLKELRIVKVPWTHGYYYTRLPGLDTAAPLADLRGES